MIIDRQWNPAAESYFPTDPPASEASDSIKRLALQLADQIPLETAVMYEPISVKFRGLAGMLDASNVLLSPLGSHPAKFFLVVVAGLTQYSFEEYKQGIVAVSNHELRTPLMIISMAAQMLAKKVQTRSGSDPEMSQLLGMITDGTQRLTSTFDKLLEYGELLTPYPVRELHKMDVNQLVSTCIDQKKQKTKHTNWHLRQPDSPIFILGDASALKHAIDAILENANTFCNPDARISVILHTDVKAKQCFLKISDDGTGMDDEQKENIFKAFYYGEDILYKHTPGLGLGLTIAQKILALHGGRIYVDSKLDSGTSVTLKIPLISTSL